MLNPIEALIQRQVERFQQGLQQALNELAAAEVEASVGQGAVRVKMSGLGEVLAVEISDDALSSIDRQQLQELLRECFQEAMQRSRQLKRDKIAQHTPLGALGIELPDIL
ncbi:MAG: YbaB/EbfC family nucleoid-associated protein [Armatimonadetes bacterium]|nr:YbaB/EbfC family nucleoid-associated protein [Armatimonadota bacterium]